MNWWKNVTYIATQSSHLNEASCINYQSLNQDTIKMKPIEKNWVKAQQLEQRIQQQQQPTWSFEFEFQHLPMFWDCDWYDWESAGRFHLARRSARARCCESSSSYWSRVSSRNTSSSNSSSSTTAWCFSWGDGVADGGGGWRFRVLPVVLMVAEGGVWEGNVCWIPATLMSVELIPRRGERSTWTSRDVAFRFELIFGICLGLVFYCKRGWKYRSWWKYSYLNFMKILMDISLYLYRY